MSTFSLIVQIQQSELDRLLHLLSIVTGPHATHTLLLDNDAHIAFSSRRWVIDYGTSVHMTGIRNKFTPLYFSIKYPPINIVDGSSATVVDNGTIHATKKPLLVFFHH